MLNAHIIKTPHNLHVKNRELTTNAQVVNGGPSGGATGNHIYIAYQQDKFLLLEKTLKHIHSSSSTQVQYHYHVLLHPTLYICQ